jgi:magnesium transporter
MNISLTQALQSFLLSKDFSLIKEFCLSAHPAIVADFLSSLEPQEIWSVLSALDPHKRAEVFCQIDEDSQVALANRLSRLDLAALVTDMSPDDRADLFRLLPHATQEMLLPALAQAERDDIRRLVSYEEGTCGSVMTSDYAALTEGITVAQAIEELRKEAPDRETIYYVYILGEDRKLLGFVSLKDLIVSNPALKVSDIMHRDLIFAHVTEDQEEGARKIAKYDLIALPVVNDAGSLVGIITHDDAIDIINQEHTEDIEKLMAIGGRHEVASYLKTPALDHFKNRVLWVVGLAAIGLISGMVIHRFEATLAHFMILALYLPMLTDSGGNTGSQAATVIIRALALRDLHLEDIFKVLFKELKVSLMLGAVLWALSYGKVLFLSRSLAIPGDMTLSMIALAIALALAIQVITSTLIGAALPMGAAALGCDPAIVASPALTTIVDITGLLIYFNVARFVLGL